LDLAREYPLHWLCAPAAVQWVWAVLRLPGSVTGSVNAQDNRLVLSSLALAAVGYVCAKGFVSHAWGIKLPLYYLAEFIPFIGGLRATQRFSILIYLAVLIVSGLGLARVLRTIPQTGWRVCVTGVCSLIFLLEVYPYKLPINAADPFAFSPVDQKIATLQQTHAKPDKPDKPLVVLHLPIYHFLETYPISEAKYMVDSTLHWARIVNGFSGTYPHGFMADMELLHQLPAAAARKRLAELAVDIIGIHPTTPAAQKTAVLEYYQTVPSAQIIPVQPDAYLIRLSP